MPVPASRDEHDLPREIAGRMAHRLIGGRDPAGRGVIVNAEVNAAAAAFGRIDKRTRARSRRAD